MSGNSMLGRATKRNGPYPAPSELLGSGGNKVIVPTGKAHALTPARQAVLLQMHSALGKIYESQRAQIGKVFLTDAEIGNSNPTLDWRLAFNDGRSAADAPHGYSAFWDS